MKGANISKGYQIAISAYTCITMQIERFTKLFFSYSIILCYKTYLRIWNRFSKPLCNYYFFLITIVFVCKATVIWRRPNRHKQSVQSVPQEPNKKRLLFCWGLVHMSALGREHYDIHIGHVLNIESGYIKMACHASKVML